MKLTGEQVLKGLPDQLWDILLDPDTLAAIMPGCKELTRVGEDQYEGLIEAKIGPVSSSYKTKFRVTDKQFPVSYRLNIDGQGRGGFVNADALIELVPDGETTTMRYTANATVGGTIARVGSRLVEAGAKFIVNQGFKALKKTVEDTTSSQ